MKPEMHYWECPLRWCDYRVQTEARGRMLVHRAEHVDSPKHREFLAEAMAELGATRCWLI